MNLKLSTVLALLIVMVFPALSLYAWQSGGTRVSEDEMAVKKALTFLAEAPTYTFDGIPGTMEAVETLILEIYPVQYVVTVTFDCRHAGYGDRTGKVLAQVITGHTARVTVVEDEVVSAILDEKWDELNQRETDQKEPSDVIYSPGFGRDTAISYALLTHGLKGVSAPSSWKEKDLTPKGLVGWSELQFTGDGWTVNVSWAVVRSPTYTVEIELAGEGGFRWEGTVDQDGEVTQEAFILKG